MVFDYKELLTREISDESKKRNSQLESILKIYGKELFESYKKDTPLHVYDQDFDFEINHNNRYTVCLHEDDIVGLIEYYINRETLCIVNVFVKEEYRNNGICNTLFNIVYEEAKSRNFIQVHLGTRLGVLSEDIYYKLGFQPYYSYMVKNIKES